MPRCGPAARQTGNAQAVILIGFMGAGKSSVGRAMSAQLGWAFTDLDDRIESRERRKVAEIFRDAGDAGFRHAEHAALKDLLAELETGGEKIIALGGGAFVQKRNARLIEAAGIPSVFLDAAPEELWERCREQAERDGIDRPLMRDQEDFRRLYQIRFPQYSKAWFRQETSSKEIEQIAAEVIKVLSLGTGRRGKKK